MKKIYLKSFPHMFDLPGYTYIKTLQEKSDKCRNLVVLCHPSRERLALIVANHSNDQPSGDRFVAIAHDCSADQPSGDRFSNDQPDKKATPSLLSIVRNPISFRLMHLWW